MKSNSILRQHKNVYSRNYNLMRKNYIFSTFIKIVDSKSVFLKDLYKATNNFTVMDYYN